MSVRFELSDNLLSLELEKTKNVDYLQFMIDSQDYCGIVIVANKLVIVQDKLTLVNELIAVYDKGE